MHIKRKEEREKPKKKVKELKNDTKIFGVNKEKYEYEYWKVESCGG